MVRIDGLGREAAAQFDHDVERPDGGLVEYKRGELDVAEGAVLATRPRDKAFDPRLTGCAMMRHSRHFVRSRNRRIEEPLLKVLFSRVRDGASVVGRYSRRCRNFGYFLLHVDRSSVNLTSLRVEGRSAVVALSDMLRAAWAHGASFNDYVDYEMSRMSKSERRGLLTTGITHDVHRQLSDRSGRRILRDKWSFQELFGDLMGRKIALASDPNLDGIFGDPPLEIILKPRSGQTGQGVSKHVVGSSLSRYIESLNLRDRDQWVIEEVLVQHSSMELINSSSVNTVRVLTIIQNGEVEVLRATARFGCGALIDGYRGGGMWAAVEPRTGIICSAAVRKGPNGSIFNYHPISGSRFEEFQIPMWNEILELSSVAAFRIPTVRSVGWDIAVTQIGPVLVEGNDNWDHAVVQIPSGNGLRRQFDAFTPTTSTYH